MMMIIIIIICIIIIIIIITVPPHLECRQCEIKVACDCCNDIRAYLRHGDQKIQCTLFIEEFEKFDKGTT